MNARLIQLIFVQLVLARATTTSAAPTDDPKARDTERFRAAVATLDASQDTKETLKAMGLLRDGFPASRPVLLETVEKGSVKAKLFSIQIIGERGEAKTDLVVVAKCLADSKAKVRLAAVMAIRSLGKDGYPALAAYLPAEADPNNRKMAIKTIQHWDHKEAVPVLVDLLKVEKEKTVRNFLVTALEALSRKKLGDDLAAWQAHVADLALQEQAKKLVKTGAGKKEEK